MSAYTTPGNAFFLAAYAVFILPQIFLGLKYRTWGFTFGMFAGLVMEIVGYAGRVLMAGGDMSDTNFTM